MENAPDLTAIVIMHNMVREAPRTLYSLSRAYQRALGGLRYRVLVLDHGSREPLPPDVARRFDADIDYRFVRTDAVSPVAAINAAAAEVTSPLLMISIDGARILSPGLLGWVRRAALLFADPLIYTLGWPHRPDGGRPGPGGLAGVGVSRQRPRLPTRTGGGPHRHGRRWCVGQTRAPHRWRHCTPSRSRHLSAAPT